MIATQKRKEFLPDGGLFETFSEVVECVRGARGEALYEAQRACRDGVLRSRGVCIKAARDCETILGEADSWPWDGTKGSLLRAVREAVEAGAEVVVMYGGYDWAASIDRMADGDYDPWVSEWGVTVWRQSEE